MKKQNNKYNKQKSKNRKKENSSEKLFSIIEIAILILAIIATGYIVGAEFRVVSGQKIPTDVFDPFFVSDLDEYIEYIFASKAGLSHSSQGPELGEIGQQLAKVFGEKIAYGLESVFISATYALMAYAAVKYIAIALKLEPNNAEVLGRGIGFGVFIGTFIAKIAPAASSWGPYGWAAAAVIAIAYILTKWKNEKQTVVVFTCGLWQPQPGGDDCDRCNNQKVPCSEYQCASLGLSCKIINRGTPEQKCKWINRDDVRPPVITPLLNALKTGYYYEPNNAVSPPKTGAFIKYNSTANKCIPPYTPFSFGVNISQEAKCMTDVNLTKSSNFSSMDIELTGGRYLKEHIITISWPNPKDLEAENLIPIGKSGKDQKLYIRCLGANNVESNVAFEFSYCIDDSPDLNPPEIIETSIINGSPVRFGAGNISNFILSINKPGQCKWSTLDRNYEDIENSMLCLGNVANYRMFYECKTNLTGIKDRGAENNFYFRCNGTYNNRTSRESYKLTLIGTEPLVIGEAGPDNETIKDSTEYVKITLTARTSAGAKNGNARCSFSRTGNDGDYIRFFNTNSYVHSQELSLLKGNYIYYIKCLDDAGNSDVRNISFKVETDTSAPAVVRAFKEGTYLKIITNEESECVYNTQNFECNYAFDDGTTMTTLDGKEHFTDWNTLLNFYIKCKDKYGNRPAQDECNIIIRPFNF